MRHYFFLACFLLSVSAGFSQTTEAPAAPKKKRKNNFYAVWGYTRAMYSRSTIHFSDHSNHVHPLNDNVAYNHVSNYDFTIYKVQAEDRPDFDKIKDVVNVTIPQFVVHAGWYLNDKHDFGFEINYDHTKYIVNDYQKVHIKGQFNGNPVDKDTTLNPKTFLHFEHSDGANFWMFNLIKRFKLYNPGPRLNVGFVIKAGPGFVYPRTDVTIFGERLNNNWHISGWIVGVESGLRVEFLKHGVFEFVGKGSYADYMKCLVLGLGNGTASHTFWCAQITATLGVMF